MAKYCWRQQRSLDDSRWYEADACCRWLGKEGDAGLGDCELRLPMELEWERAARGTDGRAYPWGAPKPSSDRASFADENFEADAGAMTAVGTYPSGVADSSAADMAGSVWEWCTNPLDSGGAEQVLRGGSWCDAAQGCRCASRSRYAPATASPVSAFAAPEFSRELRPVQTGTG